MVISIADLHTVNLRKEEPTFSRFRLFVVLIVKVHMEISGSEVFHRLLFKRLILKHAGEQQNKFKSKTFIL